MDSLKIPLLISILLHILSFWLGGIFCYKRPPQKIVNEYQVNLIQLPLPVKKIPIPKKPLEKKKVAIQKKKDIDKNQKQHVKREEEAIIDNKRQKQEEARRKEGLKRQAERAIESIQKELARKQEEEEEKAKEKFALNSLAQRVPSRIEMDYYDMVHMAVMENWHKYEYNNLLNMNTLDLKATVVIEVGENGLVKEPFFEKRSGDDVFDRNALDAIKRTKIPRPPLAVKKEWAKQGKETVEIGLRF